MNLKVGSNDGLTVYKCLWPNDDLTISKVYVIQSLYQNTADLMEFFFLFLLFLLRCVSRHVVTLAQKVNNSN